MRGEVIIPVTVGIINMSPAEEGLRGIGSEIIAILLEMDSLLGCASSLDSCSVIGGTKGGAETIDARRRGRGHSHSATLSSSCQLQGSLACWPTQPLTTPSIFRISIITSGSKLAIQSMLVFVTRSRRTARKRAAAKVTAFLIRALTMASAPLPMSSRILILRMRANRASYGAKGVMGDGKESWTGSAAGNDDEEEEGVWRDRAAAQSSGSERAVVIASPVIIPQGTQAQKSCRPNADLPTELPYLILPITLSCLAIIFLLYRHARTIKQVVQHQLQTIIKPQGAIRLSDDQDDDDADVEAQRARSDADVDTGLSSASRPNGSHNTLTSSTTSPSDPSSVSHHVQTSQPSSAAT
ncbi:hypothetical protein DL93DRAFT_2159030 [Clavulina sp. PMI_390]|nr:hypothetical protein DL93DRAFT_2159030 [Clavulina sp. PMI_390]